MTPYEEQTRARYDQIPREIMERARTDIYIHAAIRQWIDSDQTVEWLLIYLVLFLSEQYEAMRKTAIDAVRRASR